MLELLLSDVREAKGPVLLTIQDNLSDARVWKEKNDWAKYNLSLFILKPVIWFKNNGLGLNRPPNVFQYGQAPTETDFFFFHSQLAWFSGLS